jgi:DNA-binding PadR family transcriptional regulator
MGGDYIDTISLADSKIIMLAKGQYDYGYRGGTFTPGYVRKETGFGYNIIDSSLDRLVEKGYLEKSRTTVYRQGEQTEIDLFRITEKGLQTIERIRSGLVRVADVRREADGAARPQGLRKAHPASVTAGVAGIQASLAVALRRTAELHGKVDKMLADRAVRRGAEPAKPVPSGPSHRSLRADTVQHQRVYLESLGELLAAKKIVIAGEVTELYSSRCATAGIAPKVGQQMVFLLKGMVARGLVAARTVGCRELGIKGHGSRTVLTMTEAGMKQIEYVEGEKVAQ